MFFRVKFSKECDKNSGECKKKLIVINEENTLTEKKTSEIAKILTKTCEEL